MKLGGYDSLTMHLLAEHDATARRELAVEIAHAIDSAYIDDAYARRSPSHMRKRAIEIALAAGAAS